MKKRLPCVVALSIASAFWVPAASADEVQELKDLRDMNISLINLLVDQGLISRSKADELIHKAESTAARGAANAAAANRAPIAPVPVPASSAAPSVGATPPPPPPTAVASVPPPVAMPAPAAAPQSAAVANAGASLINVLAEIGYISRSKADEIIQQQSHPAAAAPTPAAAEPVVAMAPPAPPPPAAPPPAPPLPPAVAAEAVPPGTVRVPYIPEIVKNQIRDEVKQEVLAQAKTERWGEPGALPDWLQRISWSGDFRSRYQMDRFPDGNPPNANPTELSAAPWGYSLNNTTDMRNRLLIRARLGFQARITDSISGGLRLSTGGTGAGSNPVSENQELGNFFTRFPLGLDRAYLSYQPTSWAQATIGRFSNPYFAATDLVWSDNLSLDGVNAKFNYNFSRDLGALLTFGAYPIQDQQTESFSVPNAKAGSKWLFGYQTGLGWRFLKSNNLQLAVAYYDFHHVEGTADTTIESKDFDWTAPGYRQKGNTVFDIHYLADQGTANTFYGLVSKFHELNASGSLDFGGFGPMHIIIDGDYVKNLGFSSSDILSRTAGQAVDANGPLQARTVGYQAKFTAGMPKMLKFGNWQGYVGYRYVERDAVLDAFTDTDFHLGGTDAQGYFVGGRFGLAKNTFASLRWLSAREIDSPPLAIDVLQFDLNASF